MKTTIQTAAVWLFLVFVAGSSLYGYLKEQEKSRRLFENLKAANEKAEQFKTRDGQNAARITAQELTISELRKINPAVISQLKNLYIPPRLAQSYTQTSAQMNVEVKAAVKDSIVRDTTGVETQRIASLQYRDKWISISGVVDPDTAKIKVLANDTIFTAIYRGERRHPWAWILSKRQLTAAATNRNPYIKINVIQSGVIKK